MIKTHVTPRRLRRQLSWLAVAIVCLVSAGREALAQPAARPPEEASGGFMTPFPEGDTYKVQTYGDAFAEGLTAALADVLANMQRVQIIRKHRPLGALIRPEWEEDVKAEDANRETVHIAIIMTGLFDKQAIKVGTKTFSIGSDEWKEEYARRFERLIRAAKKPKTAVYIIGQPILRNSNQNGHAEVLSDLMRQRATVNGAKFIDIYEMFQEDSGGFSQFGPDISGNRVKLREGDGVMLTPQGQRKLAHTIERELKRDVEQAASDRAIPLAGDETEQKKINPARSGTVTGWKGSVTVGTKSAVQSQVPVAPSASDSSGDQKADNGRVTLRTVSATGREETTTLEIVRPAIPAAVIALLTRREAAGERAVQPGEAVVEDVGGGLTVVNSVSTLGDSAPQQAGDKRKAPAAQTAFYKVLIKGERMPPKPGRADDFAWPRPEPTPVPEVAPKVTPASAPKQPGVSSGQSPARNAPAPAASPQPKAAPRG